MKLRQFIAAAMIISAPLPFAGCAKNDEQISNINIEACLKEKGLVGVMNEDSFVQTDNSSGNPIKYKYNTGAETVTPIGPKGKPSRTIRTEELSTYDKEIFAKVRNCMKLANNSSLAKFTK